MCIFIKSSPNDEDKSQCTELIIIHATHHSTIGDDDDHIIIRNDHVVISVHMSVVLLLTYFPPHTNLC